MGPGRTLSALVRQHPEARAGRFFSSLHRTRQLLPQTLGQLWLAGIDVDWEGFYADQRRRRVPLPLYPFERQRYWIEAAWELAPATRRREDLRDWFAVPDWQRSALPATPTSGAGSWLLFRDDCGLGEEIAHQLTAAGAAVVTVSTEYEAPRSRLEERYARDWPPPSTWSTSLPAFRELVPDAYREKVAALVREIEDEGARDRGKRPVLGIEKILSQDRFKAPSKAPSKTPMKYHGRGSMWTARGKSRSVERVQRGPAQGLVGDDEADAPSNARMALLRSTGI